MVRICIYNIQAVVARSVFHSYKIDIEFKFVKIKIGHTFQQTFQIWFSFFFCNFKFCSNVVCTLEHALLYYILSLSLPVTISLSKQKYLLNISNNHIHLYWTRIGLNKFQLVNIINVDILTYISTYLILNIFFGLSRFRYVCKEIEKEEIIKRYIDLHFKMK